jgi:hypothetical protein
MTQQLFMKLSDITQDDVFRSRVRDDEDTIERYAEKFARYKTAKENGEDPKYPFPAVWVWKHDTTHKKVTGTHRIAGAQLAGLDEILVEEFTGTEDEAIWLAMLDNDENGLQSSYGDLKYCVEKALKRFTDLTAGAIAVKLGCHRSYVHRIESELSTSGQLPDTGKKKRRGANGKEYPVKPKNKKKSGKGKTKTSTTTKENKGQPPTLDEQVGEATVILDGFVEKQPSDEERVRFLDRITEWVSKRKANLSLPQDTTKKKKRSRSL